MFIQVEKSPINAKSLLKRLYSYALHPGAFKRLGAALAFNNIYTVFRSDLELFLVSGKAKKKYLCEKTFKRKYEEVPFSFQNQKCEKKLLPF